MSPSYIYTSIGTTELTVLYSILYYMYVWTFCNGQDANDHFKNYMLREKLSFMSSNGYIICRAPKAVRFLPPYIIRRSL